MKRVFFLFICLLSVSAIPRFANADVVNLSLDPLVEEMNVQPGQSGMTSVTIANNGNVLEQITIQPIDWNTRIDGGITLLPIGANKEHSLSRYLHIFTYHFTIAPKKSIVIPVSISIPSDVSSIPRSLWGGYLVRATDLHNPRLAIGPGATFFIYNDIGTPRRHLTITSLNGTIYRKSLMVSGALYNDGAGYLRVGGTVLVKKHNTTVVTEHVPIGAIFPGNRHIFRQRLALPKSGTYTVEVRFDYGGAVIVAGDTVVTIP